MCQIDLRESTVSVAAICRVLRELCAKNLGGGLSDLPYKCEGKSALLNIARETKIKIKCDCNKILRNLFYGLCSYKT